MLNNLIDISHQFYKLSHLQMMHMFSHKNSKKNKITNV